MLYPCKSGWNLPISSWDIVHTSTFGLKFGSLSPTVTLKTRSRSPKPNYLFTMSQCCIHANLVKIHPSVHEISCKQDLESVMLTPTGSALKTICPLPFGGGHNEHLQHKFLWRIEQMSRLVTKPTKWHVRPAKTSGWASAQRRLWSDWVDAQADPSLHWAHRSICWLCHEAAQMIVL